MERSYFFLMRSILLLPLSFLLHSTFAQNATLSGKIIDSETKQPLYAVTVIITGSSFGANSDFDGTFEIKDIPPGEYNVQFTYIGYEKNLFTAIKFAAGENKKMDVALNPTTLTFDDAVVVHGEKPLVDVEEAKTGSIATCATNSKCGEYANRCGAKCRWCTYSRRKKL